MPPIPHVPEPLRHQPFTPEMAAEYGVTARMLRGRQWKRIKPRVWIHRDHELTHRDELAAAVLTMPPHAHLSHISRIQLLGLDVGSHDPIHLTVKGDLHIATEGVFLHRTKALPPVGRDGVVPAAAFIQICETAPVIDAVVIGDWLLAERQMSSAQVVALAYKHYWRPGAQQAVAVLPLLDERSRSVKESEVRMLIEFVGLPKPEVNAPVFDGEEQIAIVDLLLKEYKFALEYEGRQHAFDTHQFQRDIGRYARLREAGYEYLQITHEMLAQPKALMISIDAALRRRGYDGPSPEFGPRWDRLFHQIEIPRRAGGVAATYQRAG